MMRRCLLVAGAALVSLAVSAMGQVSVVSGFDTASGWSPLLINTAAATATILPSGGNPGGYADLRAVLDNSTLGGAGFYPSFTFFTINGPPHLTDIVMSADYRWFSGPTLTLVPFLYQPNLLYMPPTSFALGTSTAWTSLGPLTFPISSFTTSSGVPLNPFAFTQVGFMAAIRSQTPTTATGRVGIDNLNIQVIPGPGTVAFFGGVAVSAAAARRRSRAVAHGAVDQ